LGIAWLVYDLYSAHRKIKIIEKDHLNLTSIITRTPINEKSVTFALSGGRLGDNLMCFLAAYYVAYENNLRFYYTPFAGSEKFCLSDELNPVGNNKFKTKMNVKDFDSLQQIMKEINNDSSTLITIAPFADVRPNWDARDFKQKVKTLIKPKKALNLVSVPSDKIAIAMHWRTGGGFDSEADKRRLPCKFPSTEYYINGLREMIEQHGSEKKFYVYLFTDNENPKELAEELKVKFPDTNIEFGYRDKSSHDQGVLEDMFSMSQFEAMIRPWSGLSQAAEIIGNAKLVYEPEHWINPLKSGESIVVPGKLTKHI
jgi:hypothetical protein